MKRMISILALLALVGMASNVRAQSQVDFNTGPAATGTVSYAGGASPLVGSSITEAELAGKNAPLNNLLKLTIMNGLLNFSTGGSNGSWSWAPGGSLSITGTVPAQTPLGGSPFAGTSGTLLSGSLVSASVVPNSGSFLVTIGGFISSVNSAINSYYGLPSIQEVGNFALSFNVQGGASAPDAFTSTTMGSGDVTSVVPAPGCLVLLCSGGVASLFGYGWRRAKALAAGVA
jgi:hypothetical protein